MKKKSILTIFTTMICIVSVHATSKTLVIDDYGGEKTMNNDVVNALPPYSYDLDPGFTISQNLNEKGLVVMKGNFHKPNTSGNIKVTIKYKDSQNNWVSVWCKSFAGNYEYNEDLTANFELPASSLNNYSVKVEVNSDSGITNWQSITWDKTITHYKQSNYTYGNCELDENQYTYLFTPKKSETVSYNSNGTVSQVKDRVTSQHLSKKLDNIALSFQGSASLDTSNANSPVINITNPNNLSTIASTQKFIYQGSDASPFEFSYHDPVYMFAGKFSNESFFINFSNWFLPPEEGGESWGRGYLDFTNPNALVNRYYTLYNYINEKLGDVFVNQQPVVIVISAVTGFRIYKNNGQYISLTATSNYGALNNFGYPPLNGKFRGPGSENFFLSNTSQASLYGVGAIKNQKVLNGWDGPSRPLMDIEREINKFISYVGIFGTSPTQECPANCFNINPGAESDFADWTKAPNSYVFTGKDQNGNNVDGLYIPVKKAYEMWEKGGEFMKNEQGNYTSIPTGTEKAGLFWEDQAGLIKSVVLEGTRENAKIKILVNKLKEGNAVVSYRVNEKIYWTWHVWVTDDPRINGSTYRLGFEKDKNGKPISDSDWKWMDRNLGATSANFSGNDWNKSQGLQYQWGRKDPFPSLIYKDGSSYEISGEVGNIRPAGSFYTDGSTSALPIKFRGNVYDASENTGYDTPNGNIRYSIQNPINMIIPPMYVRKKGETVDNNGEDMLVQNDNGSWYPQRRTTWFSKQKYRNEYNNDPYQNVAWDLWGDTRGGRVSDLNSTNDPQMAQESMSYAMKSSYDPCPCNWRVPSYYDNIGSPVNDNNASPWGKIGGANDMDSFTSDPSTSSTKFPGIKIYPGLGYDFSGVANRNLGLVPINGNYEYYPNVVSANSITTSGKVKPSIIYQDGSSDGSLGSSTFSVGSLNGGPWYGPRGLRYNSDPGNVKEASNNFGLYNIHSTDHDGNTHETSGIRCIKDPNNIYLSKAFETDFFALPAQEYSLDTLKKWAKQPNSYVEYTNDPSGVKDFEKDRVIEIPLGKAYAMHKLYLSTTEDYPIGDKKSASVVWTTNTGLIENLQIINPDNKESAKLRVTLKASNYGNAVVAFHLGNSSTTWQNGKNQDPIIWSWHIWAPETVISTYDYKTETLENEGILNVNQSFVKPVKSIGVPLETTFMDRDLGALMMFPGVIYSASNYALSPALSKSGGLHYQWGRKDPIPAFINPGGNYEFTGYNQYKSLNRYTIFTQNGPINNVIPYVQTGIDNLNYTANYAKEYSEYSSDILTGDSKKDKIKKILQYSVKNPLFYLYRNTDSETNTYKKVGDWLSNENGQFTERWGHATEKSPYDPCPEGWRIPDTFSAATYETEPGSIAGFYAGWSFSNGNNPWYYNGYRGSGPGKYGLAPSGIFGIGSYSATSLSYPGQISMIANAPATRYGFVFNDSHFNIGSFANNGMRGFNGGKELTVYTTADAKTIDNGGRVKLKSSGIWTASPADRYSGQSIGLYIDFGLNGPNAYALSTGYPYYPQTAISCRCAKIKYDGNGNEIGRYEPGTLEVPKNTTGKAMNTFAKKQIEEIQKDEKKLSLFPNPVKSILHINANDKDYFYQIYNVSGQLVKEGKFENKQTDLSSLTQGMYLVRINNAETVVKIIKE